MNKEIMLQEIESMVRILDFIQDEQSFIKRKLSSLLEQLVLLEVVAWAEDLHQEILNRETAIQLLKGDVLTLRNLLKGKRFVDNVVDPNLIVNYKQYKLQVGYIEAEFITWKHSTNEKFEEVVY
ncbi:MAG: hypothetical protein RLZ56_693 [Bacteroidota bacterium]|jgi:hypothetical protein